MSHALLEHLLTETNYYQCMVELQKQTQQSLIENQREKLEKSTADQQKCLLILETLSKNRLELIHEILPESDDLNAVLPLIADLKLRIQIQAQRQKINGYLVEIQQLNQANQALTLQAQKFIDFSLDLFAEMVASNAPQTYTAYGALQASPLEEYRTCEYNA